jgi:hypothetical protein
MALSLHQQQVDTLKTEIIFKQAQYDQAIKDGKLLRETKKMFKEIREMERRLEVLIENKNQPVREIS